MKMKAKQLIAALAVLSAAGSVLADNSLPYIDYSKFESTRNRADVVAEINPGAAGQSTSNNEYFEFTTAASSLTRGAVIGGLEQDFAEGRNAILRNPEFIDPAQFASTRTREQVRDETIQSAKSKNLVNKASGS
jgi:hypothetical protein